VQKTGIPTTKKELALVHISTRSERNCNEEFFSHSKLRWPGQRLLKFASATFNMKHIPAACVLAAIDFALLASYFCEGWLLLFILLSSRCICV
jgi:hypothetical protein